MLTQNLSAHITGQSARHVIPALSAILIGFALVMIVGFAPVAEIHNAAHDTRHTAAFPCH
jgi:cobalt transporter subunit CbtB